MSKLKAQIKLMPVHVLILCIVNFLSLVAMFIPMFELSVQYLTRKVYSNFTLLIDSKLHIALRSNTVDLNFLSVGAIAFVATIIVSVAALTLSLSYNLYSGNKAKRRLGFIAIAVLLVFRGLLHMYVLSNMITQNTLDEQGMTAQTLYATQNLVGNILVLLIFIGIVAAVYGALDLKMHLKLLSYPYMAWIVVFTILPLLLIGFRAFFAETSGGYTFTLQGFDVLFENKTVTTDFYGMRVTLQEYFSVFLRSLDYGVWTTIGCLIIGYPIAYIVAARTKKMHKNSNVLLVLLVLPMWMNTMLRTYAWRALLSKAGIINTLFMEWGWIEEPILFLKNPVLSDILTKLVMINDFLPFMIMPIYTVLLKIDHSLIEASQDLGASAAKTFTKVTLPLSLPGVISGIQMVFMPSLTFFMIPDILSEGSITTIGQTVQSFILNESKAYQQAGNVLSLMLLIFVLFTMRILRNQDKDANAGGMVL
ncbi:MAG: ABC transporter permease [Clostridia bacterium]|nr:ABC transporter permease [Clostridia bacterium]